MYQNMTHMRDGDMATSAIQVYAISSSLYITDDPGFGDYDKRTVFRLLHQVQDNFAEWIGEEVYKSCNCYIHYDDEGPEIKCYKTDGEIVHLISLSSKENYWYQWIYQFAHEYCHHLIGGRLSGDIIGMKWFEETLADLSSICNIKQIISPDNSCHLPPLFLQSGTSYLEEVAGSFQTNCLEYLKSVEDKLAQPVYHRGIYSNLSATMLPLFQRNPHLWKMITHIGDSCSYSSLEELFSHLEKSADKTYADSLLELKLLVTGQN